MPKNPGSGIRHLSSAVNQRAALGILACALTALVYQSAFDLPFVFDDRTAVLLNPALVQVWDWPGLARAWDLPGSGSSEASHSAAILSYAWDRALWGFSSFGFHLTNFILHVVVVGLFYGTCTRALADGVIRLRPQGATAGRGPGSDGGQTTIRARLDPGPTSGLEWPAFFAAAAFGLHPLMSSTALYVSARSEMVGAAAFLIALMFARRAILASRLGSGLLAVAFGAVAVASSPAGAGLPIVLLVYDGWLLRSDGWRRRLWRVYVPAMAAVVLISGWRLSGVLTESIVVWRYLALLVVPARQAIVHDARAVASMADAVAWLSLAGIGAAVAAAIWVRRSAPLVSVGVIWFFAAIAAASTIVPQRDLMAEPRLYLPAAGLMFAAFAAAAPYLAARRVPRIAATAVLAVLVVLTAARIRVWSDPLLLWTEAVERSPGSWLAHLEFSEALKGAGQCDRAVKEFAVARDRNAHLPLEPATGWAPCSLPPR